MRTQIIPAELAEYATPGSDIYYVLNQIPQNKKIPYLAIHAFTTELHKISEQYRELKIAQQKLVWWIQEIQDLYQGKPKHPISKILQPYLQEFNIKEIELLAIIEGVMLSTSTQIFETESELRQHYQHIGGISAGLKAKILMHDENINIQMMQQLGVAYEILRHLIDMPKFLSRQHLYLALSSFRQAQIDPQPIIQGKNLENLKPLLAKEFELAKTLSNEVIQKLNQEQKKMLKPLLLELKLKIKQTQKISDDAWQIFSYRLELSPLVKLLISWF